MPRLSVDIDPTYLPVLPRDKPLTAINAAMNRITERVRRAIPGAQITTAVLRPEGAVTKLLVRVEGAQMQIEFTPFLRGCVYDQKCAQSLTL